jgi:hypothetical protein
MRYVIENAEMGWAELSGMDFIPRAYGEWDLLPISLLIPLNFWV